MKTMMSTMLMLICVLAMADVPPDVERAWTTVSVMTYGESPAQRVEHLKEHGLDDNTATALVEYVDRGKQELVQAGQEDRSERCGPSRAKYETDREAFAKEVERSIANERAIKTALFENLELTLGQDASDKVLAMVAAHDKDLTVSETRVADHIRSGAVDLKDALAKTCDVTEE